MAEADQSALRFLDDRTKFDLARAAALGSGSARREDRRLSGSEVSDYIAALSSDYYWESDASYRITCVSFTDAEHERRAASILLGRRRWETGTTPVSGEWADHRAVVEARQPFKDFLLKGTEPDGYVRYLSVSGVPRFDEKGEYLGYVGVSRDITADVQLTIINDLEVGVMKLLAGISYNEAVPASMKLICRKLGWQAGRYWELDHARSSLVLKHSTLKRDNRRDREIYVPSVQHTEEPTGVIRRAWFRRSTVVGTYRRDDSQDELGLTATKKLAIPLSDRAGSFAVMEFSAARIDYPKDRLAKFVAHLGAQIGVAHDRDQAIDALRDSEERFASTFELAAVGICHVESNGRIVHVNNRLTKILGYSKEELLAKTVGEISHPSDRHVTKTFIEQLTNREISQFEVEKRYLHKDGRAIWVRIRAVMKWSKQGDPLYHVSVVEDISARKEAEAKVEHLATHDELTGLPNRVLFNELLSHSIETNRRQRDTHCAVLFIDLDRFKIINDSLGHPSGDAVLKAAAERFKNAIWSGDRVARYGGDEFVVLLDRIRVASDAEVAAKKLLDALSEPIYLGDQECKVTASIGIAVWPEDGDDDLSLIRNADAAMYAAKQAGKNDFKRYSVEMTPTTINRVRLETHLRYALERNEFRIHYQPRVDAKTHRIVGVEALIRWWNGELGTVSPVQFIPIAEDTGLIIPIGQWVLRSACEQHVAWVKRGLEPITMSVNLSPKQFADSSLLTAVRTILDQTGMDPSYLELEITESMLVSDLERAIETANRLRETGIRLAIDDFGTGYSSMMQLKRFPLDTLKIDRLFIRDLPTNQEDRAIAEAIIALGKNLGATIVAEGIETVAQSTLLLDLQCHELQGFLFGKPGHPDEVASALRENRKSSTSILPG